MAAFAPALGQSLRSRPPRNTTGAPNNSPRQLEFGEAMKNFKCMFPELDDEVIEAVLRANNGLVDATIDQLLSMGAGSEGSSLCPSDLPHLPSYSDTSPREPPPAYTPREEGLIDERDSTPRPLPVGPYSAWNPPLLGKLPDDFLRIGGSNPSPSISNLPPNQGISTERRAEHDLEQFLEDEKLAMFLQNEEFMKELRHNSDFMISLERDRQKHQKPTTNTTSSLNLDTPPATPAPPALPPSLPALNNTSNAASNNSNSCRLEEVKAEPPPTGGAMGGRPPTTPAHHEDVVLREKLRHMGKSTRKKFDKMARMFQRRKNTQKANLITGGSASTANLLEDYEDNEDDELLNVMGSGRLEIMDEQDDEMNGEDVRPQPKASQPDNKSKPTVTTYEPIVFFAEDNEFEYKSEK